jgi:hypothetical protein
MVGRQILTFVPELLYLCVTAAISFAQILSFNFLCKGNTVCRTGKYHVYGILIS